MKERKKEKEMKESSPPKYFEVESAKVDRVSRPSFEARLTKTKNKKNCEKEFFFC